MGYRVVPATGRQYDLDPGVGPALAEHVAGHVARGQPALAAQRQHHMRVVLTNTRTECKRLGRGSTNARDAVPVGHRSVDPVVDLVRKLQAPLRASREPGRRALDAIVCRGEWRDFEQVAGSGPAPGDDVRLGSPPLDRGFGGELDRLLDLGREHVDYDVAEPVLPVLHP